ncbi:MAG: hypothetical protein HZC55_25585, partial [Verrucomicrobia bacterium]|nr:hypothetical protein [Verrucomicrobiota bacterium]
SLETYSASIDLFRIISTERELITGYRYRYSDSTRNTASTDHAFSIGLSGKLIRGVKGSLRTGYQTRSTTGRGTLNDQHDSWFASGSSTYAFSRKLLLTASLAKDFSTTATDSMVDTTNASLALQYAYSSRLNASIGADLGDSRFLGEGGRVVLQAGPPRLLGANRHDTFASWDATLSYAFRDRLRTSFSYSWFRNWSTLPFADFDRSSWTASASTRW